MKEEQEEKKHPKKLGEMLIHYKIITPEQLEEGLKIQKSTGKRIGEILIDIGLVTQDEINWVLGKQLDIPYVQINLNNIDIKLSKSIPEYTLKKFKAIPIMELNDELVVAMADPTDKEAIELIKEVTKRKLKFVLASFKNIDETINRLFNN
jgi:predicted transcriptional regulator